MGLTWLYVSHATSHHEKQKHLDHNSDWHSSTQIFLLFQFGSDLSDRGRWCAGTSSALTGSVWPPPVLTGWGGGGGGGGEVRWLPRSSQPAVQRKDTESQGSTPLTSPAPCPAQPSLASNTVTSHKHAHTRTHTQEGGDGGGGDGQHAAEFSAL